MSDDRPLAEPTPAPRSPESRRWIGLVAIALLVVVPIVILIFSNLESTEVSWAGLRFNQPLWVVLIVTFIAGMVGGKLSGWAWRRWRRRRRRLKDELEVLRMRAADPDRPEGQ